MRLLVIDPMSLDFDCCFEAKTNHQFGLFSILYFTSSHGIPGDGSLALRSNSCQLLSQTPQIVAEFFVDGF